MNKQEQAIGKARLNVLIALTASLLAGVALGNIVVAIIRWSH